MKTLDRENTGLKDKNNKEIFVGDFVKFKFGGSHFFIEKVKKMNEGYYYPFNPNVKVEAGFYIDPKKCTIIN